MDSNYQQATKAVNRIKSLYPNVNENETPLPRSWSPKDKCTSIGLTQNNLRVHYKGIFFFSFDIYLLTFYELFLCCNYLQSTGFCYFIYVFSNM